MAGVGSGGLMLTHEHIYDEIVGFSDVLQAFP